MDQALIAIITAVAKIVAWVLTNTTVYARKPEKAAKWVRGRKCDKISSTRFDGSPTPGEFWAAVSRFFKDPSGELDDWTRIDTRDEVAAWIDTFEGTDQCFTACDVDDEIVELIKNLWGTIDSAHKED